MWCSLFLYAVCVSEAHVPYTVPCTVDSLPCPRVRVTYTLPCFFLPFICIFFCTLFCTLSPLFYSLCLVPYFPPPFFYTLSATPCALSPVLCAIGFHLLSDLPCFLRCVACPLRLVPFVLSPLHRDLYCVLPVPCTLFLCTLYPTPLSPVPCSLTLSLLRGQSISPLLLQAQSRIPLTASS